MMNEYELLDNGFIRVDAAQADDLSVVNSARVSFGKKIEELSQADKGLIGFLMREKHGTPFEHNFFRFHISAPIFVVREWFRHRIGWSYNEYSGRYSQLATQAYVPENDKVRTQTGKPGSYTFESMPFEISEEVRIAMNDSYSHSFHTYEKLLNLGVAKELARSVVPVSTYTEFYATTNARALMNFINLRADDTAQYEIRIYAQTLSEILKHYMPETYAAFEQNNFEAP